MLISLKVGNWLSFKNVTNLLLMATKERQHGERLPRVNKYRLRILPITAVYGGNASGKTNFFKALNFAKNFIVKGTPPDGLIPVEPFRLDPSYLKKPSTFEFQLLINERIFEYSFSVTAKSVFAEKLVEITSRTERILYERKKNSIEFPNSAKDELFLNFASKSTRENILFLTHAANLNIGRFKHVYDWFRDNLIMIAPDSRFAPFEQFMEPDTSLWKHTNKLISQLDTGIAEIGAEDLPFDSLSVPEGIRTKMLDDLTDSNLLRFMGPANNLRFIIRRKDNKPIAQKLVTYHLNSNGEKVKFELQHESDGSKRILDILPAFIDLVHGKSPKTYIFDELDRSLHTQITQELLNLFLNASNEKSRSQLLFTTHDLMLMDQKIFRRDEMWFTERNNLGESSLVSFSEFEDVRYDKDVRKSYLQGRLGGVPNISREKLMEHFRITGVGNGR